MKECCKTTFKLAIKDILVFIDDKEPKTITDLKKVLQKTLKILEEIKTNTTQV